MHQWIWPWGELYPVDHLYSIAPQYLDWCNFKCLEIVALNWKGLKADPLSSTGKRCFLHTDLMDLMTTRNKLHWSPTVEDWADLSCFFIFSNNWLMREIYLCMPSYPKLTFRSQNIFLPIAHFMLVSLPEDRSLFGGWYVDSPKCLQVKAQILFVLVALGWEDSFVLIVFGGSFEKVTLLARLWV